MGGGAGVVCYTLWRSQRNSVRNKNHFWLQRLNTLEAPPSPPSPTLTPKQKHVFHFLCNSLRLVRGGEKGYGVGDYAGRLTTQSWVCWRQEQGTPSFNTFKMFTNTTITLTNFTTTKKMKICSMFGVWARSGEMGRGASDNGGLLPLQTLAGLCREQGTPLVNTSKP